MKTAFYVGVHTGQNYSPQEYAEKAETLLNLFTDSLNNEEHVNAIVKGIVERSHTEVEVCLESYDAGDWQPTSGWELVLKAVIDLEGSGKMQLDKGKLSALLRSHEANEWGQSLKIEKKAVPKEAIVQAQREPETPETEPAEP